MDAIDNPPEHDASRRLTRQVTGRYLAGVAGGLAEFLDVDPTVVRVAFVALLFLGGLAVPLYVAGWLLIPEQGTDVALAEDLLQHAHLR